MAKFEYNTPMDIGSAFKTQSEVGEFIEYIIEKLVILSDGKEDDFIPPVVYSVQGRAFNIDYNFMINCISEWLGKPNIIGDFELKKLGNPENIKSGMFLVSGILEEYYEMVRINNSRVNLAKYKSSKSIDMKRRFYNVVVIQNDENVRRFSAVPFNESAIKKTINTDLFLQLETVAKNDNFKQIAFGIGQYNTYVSEANSTPESV
ncbi:MAG: hypothetical protein PHX13_10450 [Thiovulaceae bacterium]|nr:hypothetical protein [Sulfurimonadaceae bacterium]